MWEQYRDEWPAVKEAARVTVGMEGPGGYPTDKWKKGMLLAEHSPIRLIRFRYAFPAIKSWIAGHFVRHKVGVEHWVRTQRDDRTGNDRSKMPQDAPVSYKFEADAQALINMSRKRLCRKAHPETTEAWKQVKSAVERHDPVLASVMVPECVYRGFCPEMQSCGYAETEAYRKAVAKYRER